MICSQQQDYCESEGVSVNGTTYIESLVLISNSILTTHLINCVYHRVGRLYM